MQEPRHREIAFFPKIYRFITEYWKALVVGVISAVIALGIFFQGFLLSQNFKELISLQKERRSMTGELSYWKQIVGEYEGYRDAYFRIASLQYQLGEVNDAKKSLEMVLKLDPNFEEADVLGTKIEGQR